MKTALFSAVFFASGLALFAQVPAQPGKDKAAAKPAQAKPAVQAPKPAAPAPAKKAPVPAAAKAEPEGEESVVMIDSKAEIEDNSRFTADNGQQEEAEGAGGIPSSYGQCRGTLNDGGRSLLVFESAEDGTISLVQIVAGKGRVTWKLVDRIRRSND